MKFTMIACLLEADMFQTPFYDVSQVFYGFDIAGIQPHTGDTNVR